MTLTPDELKKGLAIDKLALDDEIIEQPVLFEEVSELLVNAMAERDAAKENLANVDADLFTYWRKHLSKGGQRATEKLIEAHIQGSVEHEEAFKAYLAAKTVSDKLEVLKNAFQQRGYMLRDLVSLYTANYFQDSSAKPSKAQEASMYAANRARLANARTSSKK